MGMPREALFFSELAPFITSKIPDIKLPVSPAARGDMKSGLKDILMEDLSGRRLLTCSKSLCFFPHYFLSFLTLRQLYTEWFIVWAKSTIERAEEPSFACGRRIRRTKLGSPIA